VHKSSPGGGDRTPFAIPLNRTRSPVSGLSAFISLSPDQGHKRQRANRLVQLFHSCGIRTASQWRACDPQPAALCPATEVVAASLPIALARSRICPWVYTWWCSQASTGEKSLANGMPSIVSHWGRIGCCLARHDLTHSSGSSWRVLCVACHPASVECFKVCFSPPRMYLILRVQVRDRGTAQRDTILGTSLRERLVAGCPAPPFR